MNFNLRKLCMLLAALMLSVALNAQTVTKTFEKASLKAVLEEVEAQTGYMFMCKNGDISRVKSVTAKFERASVSEVLDKVLGPGLTYSINGKIVTIKKADVSKPVTEITQTQVPAGQDFKAELIPFTGTVTDVNGEPVIGAVITAPGHRDLGGATTDIDGLFSFKAPKGVRVQISCIGFQTVDKIVDGSDRWKVVLGEDSEMIEETVVVGYGIQKKVNLTGAIGTVSSENIENRVAPTLTHMLQGSVPGLNISTSSGRPGNTADINIRGLNSINGGEPLVLIDGAEGELEKVNPNDVESISIIKDASAAAIYGARASFGVILVTTKAGKVHDGKATVHFSSRLGWEEPTTSTKYETRGYYSVYLNDLFWHAQNGTNYSTYTQADMEQLWLRRNDKVENPERPWVVIDQREGRDTYVYYANTDWWHELFQDQHPSQQYNVSLSGGTDHIKYFVSGGYNHEEGIFRRNTDIYNKVNFRSKLTFDITDWMSLSNNTSYFKSRYDYPGVKGVNNTFSLMTVHALASYPDHNPDGSSIGYTSFASNNYVMDGMLTVLDNPYYTNYNTYDTFSNTTELTLKPLKCLEIKGNFTYSHNLYVENNRSTNTTYSRYPGEILDVTNSYSIDKLYEKSKVEQYYATNVYATLDQTFASLHHFKVMAGFNWETKHIKNVAATGYYLMSEELSDLDLTGSGADGNKRMEVSGGQEEYALAGAFGRINYDYKEKYLFELSGRYDGSSRFSSSHRWGFFPSGSVGWRISEEDFFKPVRNTVNLLKLRYSYGSLGNQQVGYYDYIRSIGVGTGSYIFGTGSLPTIATIGAPVASDLTWERTEQHDLGVDAGFFGNKLYMTADAYIRDTKDMLTAGVALPASYGADSPKMNSADLRTKGYEIQITWRDSFNMAGQPFHYSVTGTLSDYVADVTKYDNPEKSFAKTYYEGMRWGEIWGYHTGGFFKTDEEAANYEVDQTYVNSKIKSAAGSERGLHAGDVKFLDLDNDGKVDIGANTVDNPGDRTIIGNSQPRYNYGLNMNFQWFGFDLTVFFQGVGKMDWYPSANNQLFWGPYNRPYATLIPYDFHTQIWSEDNPDTYYPRPRGYVAQASNSELSVPNDQYLQNIAYLRLKNLTFGYTLPKKVTDRVNIGSVRLYFSGENLHYWSKLHSDYIDPEMAQTNTQMRIYPWQKSYMFGIDISF